ncbi:DUF6266 family protein [Flavobacterium sp. RSB2_4_14]|uniref:DUF6266 family protein n=1 Tax=Flavobacterium sp. RSB2_4_14 TaxID=3447665 RepID=UPI003F3DA362
MGTYNKGILGPFSGKVGTVVGANWRGKFIMRSLPVKTDRLPTNTQLLQREKFTLVSEFLTPMSPVITRYYGLNTGDKTRMNQAMSYHLKEAVTYVDPDFIIDFNKVQISKGDLIGVQNPTVAAVGSDSVKYNWLNNSGQGAAKATDQLVVVLYAPLSGLYYYLLTAAARVDESVTVVLPTFFNGLEVQSWITFASEDEKSYATSIYMGSVVVS